MCVSSGVQGRLTRAIWGEITPGAILTKCGMRADTVDVITFAIFGDCRLRGVSLVTRVILPSPIDLTLVTLS